MSRPRRSRFGFTLVEMLVAVFVGSLGVVLAAKVAQVVLRQSHKGRQVTDFRGRTRLVTKQIRSDIRSAGIGSTGAVAIDRAVPVWNQMAFGTPAGYFAIPVVAGANNVAAVAIGGVTVRPGSDVFQLVVPDPASAVRTQGWAQAGQDRIVLDYEPGQPALACPFGMVYVADHSSPTGAGRTQILFVDGYPPSAVDTRGQLQFTVAPRSDVMCARVSTYWVDDQGWLHRSDLTGPGVGLVNVGGPVTADPSNVANDGIAPGFLDIQIAYRMSAEIYTQNGQAPPIGQPARTWVFEGMPGPENGLMGATPSWFETRLVRINLLARTLRRIQPASGQRQVVRAEDAAALPPIPLTRALSAEYVTASEMLTNLRYFDYGAPSGVPAEPY